MDHGAGWCGAGGGDRGGGRWITPPEIDGFGSDHQVENEIAIGTALVDPVSGFGLIVR